MSLNFPTWEFRLRVVREYLAGMLRLVPLGPIGGRESGEAASAQYTAGSHSRHENYFVASFPLCWDFFKLVATFSILTT